MLTNNEKCQYFKKIRSIRLKMTKKQLNHSKMLGNIDWTAIKFKILIDRVNQKLKSKMCNSY